MGKFVVGNGQYVIYANNREEASQILLQEFERIDDIKAKMAILLSKDGIALQNFLTNMSEENLHIHFNDSNSLIYDDPENATTKGEVRHQRYSDGTVVLDDKGDFKYELAYRYTEIQGHNADFRLAHEMGHLMLNPSNSKRFILDNETNTRHVSGLIRRTETEDSQIYGTQIQENAINLIAQLAIRGEHSADDIMLGKVDLSEFNLYKKCDDLVKLLAVSMRNDYDKEISFEQLIEQKIDSFIEHSDGTKEPANTFFYGILNDSSMIENEFDKYMGKGAWRDLDEVFKQLHQPNISKERFDNIFQEAQALIIDFANFRMQEKHKEAVARNGNNIPSLDNKISMINEMTGMELIQSQQVTNRDNIFEFPEGYYINEFGEIIRPESPIIETQNDNQISQNNNKFTLKQRIAQFLKRNNMLINIPFVERFVNRQLNVLPPASQARTSTVNSLRENFVNWLSNNGEYKNLPPIQRLSDPERMAQMQRKMQQGQQTDNKGRE